MSEVELFLLRHWDGTPEDLAACVSVLQEEARRPLEAALRELLASHGLVCLDGDDCEDVRKARAARASDGGR